MSALVEQRLVGKESRKPEILKANCHHDPLTDYEIYQQSATFFAQDTKGLKPNKREITTVRMLYKKRHTDGFIMLLHTPL